MVFYTSEKNKEIYQDILKKFSGSRANKIFLLKWGITIKFFKKFYLRSDQKYDGPLNKPVKNLDFFIKLMLCKLNYIYLKLINYFKKYQIFFVKFYPLLLNH